MTKNMKTVVVLLSTYNGSKYLEEQLDSIFAQEGVTINLIVRDDGSTDDTKKILEKYSILHQNMKVLLGENCGAENSFNKMCKYAKDTFDADYYAFCDQDDKWLNNKLMVAIQKLNTYDDSLPNLYFSNLRMVDENLNYIRDMFGDDEVKISKKMALIQLFTYGCTCVFNRQALIDYCCAEEKDIFYHDNWLFIVCAYLGNVYYDPQSYILYRQHSNNLSGEKAVGFRHLFLRLRSAIYEDLGHYFESYAKMLLEYFSNRICETDKIFIIKIANYRNNIRSKMGLFFSRDYKTGKWSKDLLIKTRILINRL